MGLLQLLFGNNSDNNIQTPEEDNSKKGIFEGGDDLTIEDMIIMDILDGED